MKIKQSGKIPHVKCFHRTNSNGQEVLVPKLVPEHLANDRELMRLMDIERAEDIEGSADFMKKEINDFKETLSLTTDAKFLEGMLKLETVQYKKNALAERIKELHSLPEAEPEPKAEIKPEVKEPKKAKQNKNEELVNNEEDGK